MENDDEVSQRFWFRGGTVTGLSGITSPEPFTENRPWMVSFVLQPVDNFLMDFATDPPMGDSNFIVPAEWRDYFAKPVEQPVDSPNGRLITTMSLQTNAAGRLGRVDVRVPAAPSSVQAYQLAKTVFDFCNLRISLAVELPLHFVLCRVSDESNEERFAIRYRSPYPIVELDFDDRFLPPVLQRMAASYIEALTTNSHFYAFLCLYKLVDALTGDIQGAYRKLAKAYGVTLKDLSGRFAEHEVGSFFPEIDGLSYREIVTKFKALRVRVAHVLTSVGFQALNAASQDQAERLSQALHIAAHNLLNAAIDNYQLLRDAKVSVAHIDRTLETSSE